MKRGSLIFIRENKYEYIIKNELKACIASRSGEEYLTTQVVTKTPKELGYEVDFSKKTSKIIDEIKFSWYKAE